MDGTLLRAVRLILQIFLIILFLLLFGLPSVRRYQEKQVTQKNPFTNPFSYKYSYTHTKYPFSKVRGVTSKSETGGIQAPSITLVALDNVTRNGWWVALPGNPDTFQFVEPQCGQAEDITACIEEKTFNQSAIIKDIILGFSSQTSLIDQELGTKDFTSSYHGMAHTINMDTKINPDDSTSQLFIIFQDLSNYQVHIISILSSPTSRFTSMTRTSF